MRQEGQTDRYNGIPWVYVPGDKVRAHPKGRLTLILWAIAAYFVIVGLLKTYGFVVNGFPVWMILLGGILPLVTGLGLMLRSPISVFLAVIQAGVTVWQIMTGGWNLTGVAVLGEGVLALAILLYLIEGERPNFIYRHRYRKYSAVKGK